MGMTITWLGHSCFRVTCGDSIIVLDPYEPGSVPGCGDICETADQVLCSHEHHDHNYRAGVALHLPGLLAGYTAVKNRILYRTP